jgi:protein-disulfide isomerase
VAVVNRHFPLSSHQYAVPAVQASECAARQGRFDDMHHALFASQSLIGSEPWDRMARDAQVPDVPAFERCMAETGPIAALARDTVAGHQLQTRGTPTFLINDHRYVGTPPITALREMVKQAIDEAGEPAPVASRTTR